MCSNINLTPSSRHLLNYFLFIVFIGLFFLDFAVFGDFFSVVTVKSVGVNKGLDLIIIKMFIQ